MVWASLSHSRPFSKLSTKPIIDGALEGLQKENPDLEAATLAVDELSQRSRLAASNGVDTIQRALDRIGHETIPWLARARQNLKHLENLKLLKIVTFSDYSLRNSTRRLLREEWALRNICGPNLKNLQKRDAKNI